MISACSGCQKLGQRSTFDDDCGGWPTEKSPVTRSAHILSEKKNKFTKMRNAKKK